METLKKIWPLFIGVFLFVGVSYFAQSYLGEFRKIFQEGNALGLGMATYVLLGVLTVVIPFGTLLPFIPLAVTLWGWQTCSILTVLSWVLGGQILFEAARALGKPFMARFIPAPQMDMITKIMQKKGLFHSILIRVMVHGDIVSYGFGLFTDVGRFEFFLITLIGVTPGAIVYCYLGSLPVVYQVLLAVAGLVALTGYWTMELEPPMWLKRLRERISV